MLFDAVVADEAGWTVIAVAGELDLATVPRVRPLVVQAVASGATNLVIDLSGVELLDSAGLGLLAGARRRVRQADPHGEVRLVVTAPAVQRVLELSGLAAAFPTFADRRAAVAPGVGEGGGG